MENHETQQTATNGSNAKPTHYASIKKGYGKAAQFERVGVAWLNDDSKITIQLYGTQLIEGRIYCSKIKQSSGA